MNTYLVTNTTTQAQWYTKARSYYLAWEKVGPIRNAMANSTHGYTLHCISS